MPNDVTPIFSWYIHVIFIKYSREMTRGHQHIKQAQILAENCIYTNSMVVNSVITVILTTM